MSVLLLAGSPTQTSRSAALLDWVGHQLSEQGIEVERINIRELSAPALMLADFDHPSVVQAIGKVAQAKAVVVATPIYKAAYSGLLKVFLDLLPNSALKGKTVLPLASGGSAHHMLALDYALRPVLQSLGARNVLSGVYATDLHITLTPEDAYVIHADIAKRLEDSVNNLLQEGLLEPSQDVATPVLKFASLRC